jgi:hypothetical protein
MSEIRMEVAVPKYKIQLREFTRTQRRMVELLASDGEFHWAHELEELTEGGGKIHPHLTGARKILAMQGFSLSSEFIDSWTRYRIVPTPDAPVNGRVP